MEKKIDILQPQWDPNAPVFAVSVDATEPDERKEYLDYAIQYLKGKITVSSDVETIIRKYFDGSSYRSLYIPLDGHRSGIISSDAEWREVDAFVAACNIKEPYLAVWNLHHIVYDFRWGPFHKVTRGIYTFRTALVCKCAKEKIPLPQGLFREDDLDEADLPERKE